ncbi:ribosomal protein S18-alanine N-acetyltransferase [Azohydromonas caseinilytica]|uniref:[Ribosomal protein bS18]-alanine N-acetyltransferase n=1 Tax=Azohydromonas caseinilytica TaxID=2728836 RepID=A0A848F2M1_9BURK|nr:ribosomal protein S18-alanine N-acetyltransferase [Azohydromonas caseinilytica]NML13652.1 ribosomal protein S18-alanine N-acetyltransferase [Azohydromonas caseinilytica]
MRVAHLDAVMALEQASYEFPWTRGNFIDSLHAGYPAQLLRETPGGVPVGYYVAMAGFDEMHLLNITVAPAARRRGYARFMLDALAAHCRQVELGSLWLEVRESNTGARELYERYGFALVGRRRGYYPAQGGRREDALLMSLVVAPDEG